MSKELEALEIECGELVEMDLLFLDRNGENQEKWHNSEAFKKAVEFEKKYGKSHTYILKQALQRLEQIDNADSSEALNITKATEKYTGIDLSIIKKALQRLDEYEQILGSGRLTDRNYKNTTLDLDSCKPYLRLGELEDIYEESKHNE